MTWRLVMPFGLLVIGCGDAGNATESNSAGSTSLPSNFVRLAVDGTLEETIMVPNGSPLGSLLTATGRYQEGFVGQTQTVLLRQQP